MVLSMLLIPQRASAVDLNLTADREVAAPGETVTFTASGDFGDSPAFFWEVDGQGIQHDSPSLQWAFQAEGQHTVTVYADVEGQTANASITVQITSAQANHPPSVSVTSDKPKVSPGESVKFTASVADPDPNDSVALAWYVDGSLAPDNGLTLTRSFAKTGDHTVRVVATDLSQASSEATTTVTVAGTAPTATIVSRSLSPRTRTVTLFDASGSLPSSPSASITAYIWDLNGNGTFETSCPGPVVGVRTAEPGNHTVSVMVIDDSGAASPSISAVISFVAAASERRYDDRALTPTAGGCAGPLQNGVVPEGYDAEDMTCYTTVRTGIAEAMSPCFRRRVEGIGSDSLSLVKELYASTQTVRLNGIDVRPNSGSAIEIDTFTHDVKSLGGGAKASVDAGSTLGKLTFFSGVVNWDLPGGKTSRFNLGKVSITKAAELFGLKVEGDARLDLVYRGAEIPVTIHLPAPLDISATVTLKTDNLKGLRLEEVYLRVKNATFGAFAVNDLELRYNSAASQFDGFADMALASVGRLKVSIQVIGKTVTMFAADFTPTPPLLIGSGVFLQHIDFNYDAGPPLTLLGGVKVTAGPPINGTAAAAIDGRLKFVASDPWLLRADGNATIAGFGVASAYLQYQSSGMIKLGGRIDARLYDIVGAKANIDMWLNTNSGRFNAQAGGEICVWKGCGGGAVVISSTGIGGCVYTFWANFGLGYRWDGSFKFYLTGCDINHWASAFDGSARLGSVAGSRAVSAEDMTVKPGQRHVYFRFASADNPPQVTVTGPDGTEIVVPAGTENFVENEDYIILQIPPEHATYVIVRDPAPGRWQVTTADGSPELVAVAQASALPAPKVKASVGGDGRARTLDYTIKDLPGQRVQFVERAGRTFQRLADVTDAKGRIRFRPATGPAGTRSIFAIVQQDGAPREEMKVASYRAPGPQKPGATKRVTIKRTATKAVATWPDAARVQGWLVVATASDGRRWSVKLDRRKLVLPRVFRGKTVKVKVRGISKEQVLGPARVRVSRGH
jgi:hypothetical protein